MNKPKAFTFGALTVMALFALSSCGGGDPYRLGTEAGKAACKCYQIKDFDEQHECITEIEREYREWLEDTAFLRAMEVQTLNCIGDGVLDIVSK